MFGPLRIFISSKIQKKIHCQNPQKDFSYESNPLRSMYVPQENNLALLQKKSTAKIVGNREKSSEILIQE